MKNLKMYAFLTLLYFGSASLAAQSIGFKNKLITKASHNGVRHNAQSFIFINDWFSKA